MSGSAAPGAWLLGNWWLLAVLAAVVAGAGGLWLTQWAVSARWERVHVRRLRYGLPQLDGLHHEAFEFAVRDLMRRDGCADAVQVGGAGDNGADVPATDPLGRRWVTPQAPAGWGLGVGCICSTVERWGSGREVHGRSGSCFSGAPDGVAAGVVVRTVVVLITGAVPVPSGSGRCEAVAEPR
ncbi:hypothetical protein [Streptomyces sp. NPDC001604]|uniref:hypothetical protein n=1 Tax=Streptomyces sp. NPDC001604 TaxID=3364593 RepID=UPI0036AF2C99